MALSHDAMMQIMPKPLALAWWHFVEVFQQAFTLGGKIEDVQKRVSPSADRRRCLLVVPCRPSQLPNEADVYGVSVEPIDYLPPANHRQPRNPRTSLPTSLELFLLRLAAALPLSAALMSWQWRARRLAGMSRAPVTPERSRRSSRPCCCCC